MDRRPFGKDFWLGELDARHMALFRVLLALVVLWDVGDRLRDFHAFYTDAGLFDHHSALVHIPLSLGRVMGEPWQAGLVFALAGVGALGMLVGLWTRWSTILTLVAVLGIQHRNPFVLDGGDVALRVTLFWSIFVDLGAVASLDARRRGARPTIDALPVRMLQLQVIFLHCATGLFKSGAPWRDGTAVYRALQDTPFTRDTAAWLMALPWLCAVLTWATLIIEIGAPLWMYSPWQHGRVRAIGVFATHALHAGIFLTMRVGIFSLIMQAALVACWRAEWIPAWRRTPPPERGTRGSPRLLWLGADLRRDHVARGDRATAWTNPPRVRHRGTGSALEDVRACAADSRGALALSGATHRRRGARRRRHDPARANERSALALYALGEVQVADVDRRRAQARLPRELSVSSVPRGGRAADVGGVDDGV